LIYPTVAKFFDAVDDEFRRPPLATLGQMLFPLQGKMVCGTMNPGRRSPALALGYFLSPDGA
jgi:hypothetical protein